MYKKESYKRAKLDITRFRRDAIRTDNIVNSQPTRGGDTLRIIMMGKPISGLGSMNGNR